MSLEGGHDLCVSVLVDNACVEGLASEWGLSLHLAFGSRCFLLDFGQTDAFARNAATLGIDLSLVDAAILSHAHYDHADGMDAFFAANDHAPLFLSEASEENLWSTSAGHDEPHYIGVKPNSLERNRERLVRLPTDRISEIAPDVLVVPHGLEGAPAALNPAAAGMYAMRGGRLEPDTFGHEISLVVRTRSGVNVFSSCSHVGLERIVGEVERALPGERIVSYVGGLHLMHATGDEVRAVASSVHDHGIERLICGHCTGDEAVSLLCDELPGRVEVMAPGKVFML